MCNRTMEGSSARASPRVPPTRFTPLQFVGAPDAGGASSAVDVTSDQVTLDSTLAANAASHPDLAAAPTVDVPLSVDDLTNTIGDHDDFKTGQWLKTQASAR